MIRALLLSGIALFTLATGVFAADLPNIKEPVYAPPPPAFSWTGFYVGVNGGYGGGRFVTDYFNAATGASVLHEDITSGGFLGGGQVGFNYQFPSSNIVAGFETDFDGSTISGQQTVGVGGVTATIPNSSKIDWLGTARARLGMSFGNVLPYITGGFAYAHEDQYAFNTSGAPFNYSFSSTRPGWTAGAGLEYAITHNLTFKTEYLYVDLSDQYWRTGGTAGVAALALPGVNHSAHATFNIVRAGLDWKFDWIAPPTPVVAKY